MCKDLQTKTETFGKHSIEASTPLPAEKQLCFTVGQFPMFSFSVQTRDFLSSMATTLHLLKEAVPIISRAEWKILKWHCLLAPGFNLLMFSIPMVPVHSSTLLKSFASGDNSQVLHCPRRGSFSITGDKSFWRSHQPPAPPSKSCLCTIHRTRFLLFPTRQSSQFEDSPCHEDLDGPGLPFTGLEVILPLFWKGNTHWTSAGPTVPRHSWAKLSLPSKESFSIPSELPLHRSVCFSRDTDPVQWPGKKPLFCFGPSHCHFSELHQLGLRPHEHQDQPKACNKNKIGGEVRPIPFSDSELMMKLHPLMSQVLLY